MKKRVLFFCDFYLPSIGGGGGTWAVANIVERFSDRYDFFVATGNRNLRGSRERIAGIREDEWNRIGNAAVWYTRTLSLNASKIRRIFADAHPDIVFLNGAFSTPTIRFLHARRTGSLPDLPVILAPCGEFLPGALAIKPQKKRAFLTVAKAAGLYRGVIWRASFESEREAIESIFGKDEEILLAADLTPKEILPNFNAAMKPEKRVGHAKLLFLSRISKKKNLHFLVEQLRTLEIGTIELEIVGPGEDAQYWESCKKIIETLPANIKVVHIGGVDNENALRHLVNAHFFVLPTLSENFGFVFIEALAAGCPLLISDRTDWNWVEDAGAGWIAPLENADIWRSRIAASVALAQADYTAMSETARNLAVKWLAEPRHEAATAELLAFAAARGKVTL